MYTYECNSSVHPAYVAHVREYDGMSEFLEHAHEAQRSTGRDRDSRSSVLGTYDFTGTHSLDEAIDLATYGWPEGRKMLEKELDKLEVEMLGGQAVQPEIVWDEVGAVPDVGRYLEGEPECVMEFAFPPDPPGQLIDISVNVAQDCEVPRQAIIRRGAAIIVAAQKLQLEGYSVGLAVHDATLGVTERQRYYGEVEHRYNGKKTEYHVSLARPGENIDLDAVAFTFAHPSFLRRIALAAMEAEPHDLRTAMAAFRGESYGSPDESDHIPKSEHITVAINSGDAMIGGVQAAQGIINKVVAAVVARQTQ